MIPSSSLHEARKNLLSQSNIEQASIKINELKTISPGNLHRHLAEYFATAQGLARSGDVQGTVIMLRVFDHFNHKSYDAKLLYFIAEAEASHEKQADAHPHSIEMKTALHTLTKALLSVQKN